jgi:site-specific DNA recombinase
MKITERFRMGKIRKVKEGNIIVSTPMYGYDYIQRNRDTNTNGYYVVNEHEARVVRMIFAWVAEEGCTTRGAAQRLKELGIPPKRSKRGVWHPSSVGALLKNKGYTGEWAFGRTYFVVPENPIKTEKYRRVRKSSGRKRPEESWIKAKIPAIIDNELFEKAQKQLRENFVLSKRKTKSEYLLRGKIKCSCGKPMSGDMGNGKYKYYRCPDRIYNFPAPRNCFSRALNGKNTENAVWDMVTSLMTSPETIWEHLQLWSKEIKAQSMAKADLLAIENELKKIGIQEARFTQAYAAGTFSLSRLQHYLEPVHKKKEALEGELTIIKDRQVPEMSLPDKTEISAFCERAALKLTELSFAQKREILLDVVDKIRYEGDTLKVSGHLKMPKDISGMCPDGYYNEDTITKNISINNYNIPFQFEIQIKRDSRNRAK